MKPVKPRKARVGYFVPTSHNGLIDDYGQHFPIMGVAERLHRQLEKHCDVVSFGHLIEGDITGPQMPYNLDIAVDTRAKAWRMAELCREADVDAVVLFMPTFLWQHLYVQALAEIDRPIVLWGNDGVEACEAIGLWAMRGTLDAVGGFRHRDIYASPDSEDAVRQAVDYIEAARVVRQLRRSVMGIFGTMAMGMIPGLWEDIEGLRTFGVGAEHLECQSLAREGEHFSKDDVEREYQRWCGLVRQPCAMSLKLERTLRLFLGHKKLIDEFALDFDGVKNTFELSNYYVDALCEAAFMNETGYVSSVSPEPKGALTMYLMRLLADAPHYMGDIEQVDRANRRLVWASVFNIGATAKTADGRYDVELTEGPDLEGEAGSVYTKCVLRPGPITIARLQRADDTYKMQLARGEVIPLTSEIDESGRRKLGWKTMQWGISTLQGDTEKFIRDIRSQYSHMIYADVYDKLLAVCELLGVEPLVCE